jgi:hypothetical protein
VAEVRGESFFVHLTAPLPDHNRRDAVPDQVGHGHPLPHETMDAEDERYTGDRYDTRRGQRAREDDQRGAGNPGRTLRCEQEHGQQRQLPRHIEGRVRRLSDEHGRDAKING